MTDKPEPLTDAEITELKRSVAHKNRHMATKTGAWAILQRLLAERKALPSLLAKIKADAEEIKRLERVIRFAGGMLADGAEHKAMCKHAMTNVLLEKAEATAETTGEKMPATNKERVDKWLRGLEDQAGLSGVTMVRGPLSMLRRVAEEIERLQGVIAHAYVVACGPYSHATAVGEIKHVLVEGGVDDILEAHNISRMHDWGVKTAAEATAPDASEGEET